jgi:hypothetical protein
MEIMEFVCGGGGQVRQTRNCVSGLRQSSGILEKKKNTEYTISETASVSVLR